LLHARQYLKHRSTQASCVVATRLMASRLVTQHRPTIHFDFRDGSRLERAFTYDWRLWTIPELRELLAEAGFREVQVWWETVDEDGDGTGDYEQVEHAENQEAWLVYLVAAK
jgi:hypothetical protein